MIPNDRAFNGKSSYEDNGKTITRWHQIKYEGEYQLQFRFVSVNSIYRQGIALFFSEFAGQVLLDGVPLKIPKNVFGHYVFREDEFPSKEFILSVCVEKGYLFFGSASERPELGIFTSGAFGNAFWFEEISDKVYRFHCNDHEMDDDFDDMIFEMSVII